jgi:hypothetical protein
VVIPAQGIAGDNRPIPGSLAAAIHWQRLVVKLAEADHRARGWKKICRVLPHCRTVIGEVPHFARVSVRNPALISGKIFIQRFSTCDASQLKAAFPGYLLDRFRSHVSIVTCVRKNSGRTRFARPQTGRISPDFLQPPLKRAFRNENRIRVTSEWSASSALRSPARSWWRPGKIRSRNAAHRRKPPSARYAFQLRRPPQTPAR